MSVRRPAYLPDLHEFRIVSIHEDQVTSHSIHWARENVGQLRGFARRMPFSADYYNDLAGQLEVAVRALDERAATYPALAAIAGFGGPAVACRDLGADASARPSRTPNAGVA